MAGSSSRGPRSLNQDFQKRRARKSRFSFVAGSENGLILKLSDSRPTRMYEPPEELCEAFKTPAQIEDEGVWVRILAGW